LIWNIKGNGRRNISERTGNAFLNIKRKWRQRPDVRERENARRKEYRRKHRSLVVHVPKDKMPHRRIRSSLPTRGAEEEIKRYQHLILDVDNIEIDEWYERAFNHKKNQVSLL
jgi:hypothetical protein